MKSRVFPIAILALALAVPAFSRPYYEPAILMYHRVGYPNENPGLYVTPRVFEAQMEFLKAHHFRVMPLEEIVRKIKARENLPMNTVAITFDDGNLDVFKNAFPVLKKMEFPATVFMITGNIDKEDWLSREDLRILDENGITVGSHTVNHAFLPAAADTEASAEIADSKRALEEVLGHPVTLFSYPAGGMNARLVEAVREAGYEGAVTTNYKAPLLDPYALRRVKVSDANGSLFNFWAKTSGFYHLGKKRVEAEERYE